MKISIKIKLKSKIEKIEKIKDNFFEIYIKEPPIKEKANKKIIEIISDYFKVSSSKIKIVSGLKSRNKIIEINK